MPNTRTFVIYLFIVIFFNLFAGSFSLTSENNDISIKKTLVTTQIKDKILTHTGLGDWKIFSATANILALPFIILESLIFIISIIGIGFTVLPAIVEIILFTPLGIIVVLDYVIPVIRG